MNFLNICFKVVFLLFVVWLFFVSYPSIYWFLQIETSSTYWDFNTLVKEVFQGVYLFNAIDENFLSEDNYLFVKRNLTFLKAIFFCLSFSALSFVSILFWYSAELKIDRCKLDRPMMIAALCLMITWLVYKVGLYQYFPLHVDEVFDFVNFTRKDFLVRHSYQFQSNGLWFNNHVLYTDISHYLYAIGFSSKLAIRLPSIFAEGILLVLVFTWSFSKDKVKPLVVCGSLLLSFWSGLYSVQGRSYMLIALLCFVSFLLFEKVKQYRNTYHLFLLVSVLALGVSLSRLFLLPVVGLCFYFLVDYSSFTKSTRILVAFSFCIVFFLGIHIYFPTFLLSGWGNIIPTRVNVKNSDLIQLFPEFLEGLGVMTNSNAKAYVVVLLITALYVRNRKKVSSSANAISTFMLCQLFTVVLYSLATKSYLPFRAMIYLNVLFGIAITLFVYDLVIENSTRKSLVAVLFLALVGGNTLVNFKYSWVKKLDYFIWGKEFYALLESEIQDIDKRSLKKVYIDEKLSFHLLYCKLKFENKVLPLQKTSILQKGDIIISQSPLPSIQIIKKSSIDGSFIQIRQ